MTSRAHPRTESGFTLVELLVVIAVLGVLSGVAVLGVGHFVGDSQHSACAAEARTITVAQEAHATQTGSFGDLDTLVAAGLLSEPSELHRVDLVGGDWQLVPLGACAGAVVAAPEDPSGGADDPGPEDDLPGIGEPVADESDCSAGQVDLNNASIAELDTLVHIGPARAEQIVSLRPFASVEDLVRVSGIGPSRVADIVAQGRACV